MVHSVKSEKTNAGMRRTKEGAQNDVFVLSDVIIRTYHLVQQDGWADGGGREGGSEGMSTRLLFAVIMIWLTNVIGTTAITHTQGQKISKPNVYHNISIWLDSVSFLNPQLSLWLDSSVGDESHWKKWSHLEQKPFSAMRRFGFCDKALSNLMGN